MALRRYLLPLGAAGLMILLWRPLSRLFWQVLWGAILAAAALPLSRLMEKRFSRALSALFSILLLFLGVAGLIALFLPPVLSQISLIITHSPQWIARAKEIMHTLPLPDRIRAPEEWMNKGLKWAAEQLPRLFSLMSAGISALSHAFLSPLLAYYFLRDRETFAYQLSLWIPLRYRKRILTALQAMRKEAGEYIRGQLLISLSVALLTAAGLFLAGVPAWLILGLVMGICELIPYVGPLIGTLPIVIFALPLGFSTLLWSLGVSLLVQQLEGYFLSPRLMAGATGLHPVYVVLLLSAGGMLGGLMGMVLILPVFVCLRGGARALYETGKKENVNSFVKERKMSRL